MPMAKSTYYFELNKKDVVAERNQELLEEIKNIFEENKHRYGVLYIASARHEYKRDHFI